MEKRAGRAEIERRIEEIYKLVGAIIMRKYSRYARIHGYDDLVQECVTVIVEKADQFDSARGTLGTFVGIVVRDVVGKNVVLRNRQKNKALVLSLDAPITADDDSFREVPMIDTLSGGANVEEMVLHNILRLDVQCALGNLADDRMRRIIEMRMGFHGQTLGLRQIGAQIGLSGERVRQLERRALRLLRLMLMQIYEKP